ncbi:MAG: transposase family protein [Aquiluna sp.]
MSTPARRVSGESLKSELEHLSPVGLKGSLEEGFGELPDPRRRPHRCKHPLLTVIGIGVLAIIAGGKGWEDMELYGQCKRGWLSQVLALPEGVPSADTFRRVLSGAEKSWIALPARITGYFRDLYSGLRLTEESALEAIACGPFCKS